MSTWKPFTGIQLYRCWLRLRSSGERDNIAKNSMSAMRNDAAGAATPSTGAIRCTRRPASSKMAEDTSGIRMIATVRLKTPLAATGCGGTDCAAGIRASGVIGSVLQQVGVVDRSRAAGTEDRHDDGQADDDLGRGHDHHEERDHLTVEVAVDAGERDEAEVHRVEHQLDAHEDDDRVAAYQDAGGADAEEHCRQEEVVVGSHAS